MAKKSSKKLKPSAESIKKNRTLMMIQAYTKSAQDGNLISQLNLGRIYFTGDGVDVDFEKSFFWYEKAALQGSANAQFLVGLAYQNGQGVAEDQQQGHFWMEKALQQGHSGAQVLFAKRYLDRNGADHDDAKAFLCAQKAADFGVAQGQTLLAMLYTCGIGTEKDIAKAITYYRRAAAQGESAAKRCIDPQFVTESGVDSDFAATWLTFQIANQAGDQELAISKMIELMVQGGLKGLPIDQMYPMVQQSASQGDSNGQVFLGFMHEQGVGVPQDKNLAIACYRSAAAQGNPTALMRLRELRVSPLDEN
jgi:TPR repeat protein